MNKKFSTLVAALVVAGAWTTLDAQTYSKYTAANTAAKVIESTRYYQLKNGGANDVLAMEVSPSGVYTLTIATNGGATDLKNTLWSIEYKDNATLGYSYMLKNVGTNQYLAIDTKGALKTPASVAPAAPVAPTSTSDAVIGNEIIAWTWVGAPDPVSQTFTAAGLQAYFGANNDSIVALTLNSAKVNAIKYASNNVPTGLVPLTLSPVEPGATVLTADDLNSMLWQQSTNGKMKLTFNPDVLNSKVGGNLLSKNAYTAVPAQGWPAANGVAGADPFTGATSETALVSAENALYKAEQTKTLVEALLAAVMDNGAVDGGKLTALSTALNLVVADHATISAKTTVKDVADAVEAAMIGTGAEEVAAKKAIIAYVNGVRAVADATGIALTVSTGLIYDIDAWITANINASDAQATVDAAVKTEYVDKVGTGITVLTAALTNEQTNYSTTFATAANTNGWVSLLFEEGATAADNTYLTVAENFITTEGGLRDLGFAIRTWKDAGYTADTKARLDLNGRYNFQFIYHPYQDSLEIRTAGWAKKLDTQDSWKDMNTTDNGDLGENQGTYADADHYGNNVVKIKYLTDEHSEVTLGTEEKNGLKTINTLISLNGKTNLVKTTLAEGVYFFNLVSNLPERKVENGKYVVADFCGSDSKYVTEETFQNADKVQNFLHMPRTQWVVEQNPGAIAGERTVNIYNREFGDVAAWQMKNVQLYKDEEGNVFAYYANNAAPVLALNDTLSAQKIDDTPLKDKYLGYKVLDAEKLMKQYFEMSYLHGTGVYKVQVSESAKDTVVYADLKAENGVRLQLEAIEKEGEAKFGYQAGDAAKHLYRQAYRIRVYDSSKLSNDSKYIAEDEANEKSYVITSDVNKASKFYLKENNETNEEGISTCYYALIEKDAHNGVAHRVGVRDASLKFSIENKCAETRVATFSLEEDKTPLYRRLNVTNPNDELADLDTVWAKIYDVDTHEYLYEDANSVYSKGKYINFLGIENKNVSAKAPSLFIDTAYVRNETRMPQYMIAVDVTSYAEGKHCPYDPSHNTEEYLAAHPEGCPHAVPTKGYKVGRYLVNSADSVAADLANGVNINDSKYSAGQQYTRLHFVWAKHIEDTLVIMRKGPKFDLAEYAVASDSIMLGDNLHNGEFDKAKADWETKQDTLNGSHKNGTNNAVFAFRLVDDAPEADFLIESEGNHAIPDDNTGGWVKNHNGIPVVAKYDNYHSAIQDALIFNIEKSTETPTANEGINASEVSVIAKEGAVVINGAAGKTVTISNVLGQTIANTVLSSDNATISAPAGVVVVAVEGEAAVKAIVK